MIRGILGDAIKAAPICMTLFSGHVVADAEFDCVMDPAEVVRLATSSGGIIASMEAERGSEVRAGQPVAHLSSQVEEASLKVLETRAANLTAINAQRARLRYLEARLERLRSLNARGLGTLDELQEIEAEAEASRNLLMQSEIEREIAGQELARAKIALETLVLRSPIDGLVTEKARAVGEYLHPESHVVTIVGMDPLHVETFLPVMMYGRIAEGDVASVRPAAPVEGEYQAEVIVVDKVFDVSGGSFGVRLSLSNPDNELPAGHRCVVEFVLKAPG
ncbi:efflux RND transporter periplasmic adaptor subunit [Halomonas urumqiensis]|uniref:Efflux RND transporter periplasmic adaptor subunit n=1 Tax=Halomonas urumqiensis TaxID=1684789 RepID=A0A2N7UCU4_9GAMM|nr:efflux RND transporter periplasmic adaptor subunit [Halomonas urumqiensis]PMR78278.1 efflux RND transporter periplasmic adaptor subunit [Halomonas urumqiensis]PTB03425.1 efflux RND transporter periplasmic adaptor subunit [Halomonas urumqiensis]GHE20397.1 hypothetical protein GCM10017767_09180 [Halomonas urumqiensis]